MTTPARQAEADRVELVYYWALNQLGNAMAIDSLDLWQQVPATPQAAQASWWLTEVIRLLFGFRREAADLAVAYYRLVRALRTGFTVATGTEKAGETVTLEQLRADFEAIVDHIDANTASDAPDQAPSDSSQADEDDDIEIEEVADIEQLIADSNEVATQEAIEVLDTLGIENMLKKLDKTEATDAHADAGNRQAAAAMRIMMNAARGLVFDLADLDARVQGWVRYSQTGHPCGWCAMLISRGVVYKSQASALAKTNKDGNRRITATGEVADHDKYHDNCRCVAVPIFFLEQYDNGAMFSQNRALEDLWDDLRDTDDAELIEKYGTTDLLVIFRKLMRELKQQVDAAQAAA